MEEGNRGNQKLMYKVLRNFRKDKQHSLKQINVTYRKVIIADKEIIGKEKEDFEDLLNIQIQINA